MTFLRSPIFWILFAVFAVFVVFFVRRTGSNRSWGFKELVKDPSLWSQMSAGHQKIEEEMQAAQNWSADQVTHAVMHFVFEVKTSRDAWGEKRILNALGARVHPPIIHILRNPSVRSQLTVPTGTDLLPEAPINRVCDLLAENPPAEVVELLAPFLDDPSPQIRKDAALVIGNVGSPAIVKPLRKAFADKDEYVRTYALMGLERATKGRHLDQQCERELFDDLQKLIAEGRNADHATGLLLDFDKERATAFFLSPVIFTPTSRSLHEALEAMAKRKILVPRDQLIALIKELEGSKLEYPRTYALGEALRLLGQQQQAEDRPFLEARITHAEARAAEGAAAGLLAANGLEGFQGTADLIVGWLAKKRVKQG